MTLPSTTAPDGGVRRTCRECGVEVVLSGLVAYESDGPWDLCDRHYRDWCRENLQPKDPA